MQVNRYLNHGIVPIIYNSFYTDEPRAPEKVAACQDFIDRYKARWPQARFMVAGGLDVDAVSLQVTGQTYQLFDMHILEGLRTEAAQYNLDVRQLLSMPDDMVLGGYLAVDESQADKYQPGWWKNYRTLYNINPPTFNTGPAAIGWYLREVGAEFFLYFITLKAGEDPVLWNKTRRLWTPAALQVFGGMDG